MRGNNRVGGKGGFVGYDNNRGNNSWNDNNSESEESNV